VSPRAAVHVGAIGLVGRAAASALLRTLLTTLLRRFGCSFRFMLLRSQPQEPNLASPHHNKIRDRRLKHCARTLAATLLLVLPKIFSVPAGPDLPLRLRRRVGWDRVVDARAPLLLPVPEKFEVNGGRAWQRRERVDSERHARLGEVVVVVVAAAAAAIEVRPGAAAAGAAVAGVGCVGGAGSSDVARLWPVRGAAGGTDHAQLVVALLLFLAVVVVPGTDCATISDSSSGAGAAGYWEHQCASRDSSQAASSACDIVQLCVSTVRRAGVSD